MSVLISAYLWSAIKTRELFFLPTQKRFSHTEANIWPSFCSSTSCKDLGILSATFSLSVCLSVSGLLRLAVTACSKHTAAVIASKSWLTAVPALTTRTRTSNDHPPRKLTDSSRCHQVTLHLVRFVVDLNLFYNVLYNKLYDKSSLLYDLLSSKSTTNRSSVVWAISSIQPWKRIYVLARGGFASFFDTSSIFIWSFFDVIRSCHYLGYAHSAMHSSWL